MEMNAIDLEAATETRAAFTCEPKALADAAGYLAKRIVERRGSIPILAYVRIVADPRGMVTLTGTDLDCEASVTIAASVSSPGVFCADAAIMAEMATKVRKAGGYFYIEDTGNNRAVIKAGRNRFNVPTLPADDFPVIQFAAPLSAFFTPAAQFIGDLAALAPCMGKTEKYYLQGIAMQARDMAGRDSLVLVATDGHQMGIASRPIPAGAGELVDCIVPSKAVAALVAARKAYPDGDTLSVESTGTRLRIDLGDVVITSKLIDGTFPDWARVWSDDGPLAPIEAQEVLFPDLLPGAPAAMLEKVAKPFKGAVAWSPAREGQLGTVAGDDGLLFGVLNLSDDGGCSKKGFSYSSEHGQGEIVGPDGVTYPVAFSDKAISLSAAQVRVLVGESCFETFAITIAGRALFILQWLWDQGDGRFLTVREDGRCFPGGEYVTRAQVEAALAGDCAEIASPDNEAVGRGDAVALDSGEVVEALCEAPTPNLMPVDIIVAETLSERWVREDAFIGPCLPRAPYGSFNDPAYPVVVGMSGTFYAVNPATGLCEGPYADLIAARVASVAAPDHVSEAPEAEWVCAPDAYDAADPDPFAELVARIEALEARLPPLSAEAGPAPTVAKRTLAHERAIRRAWAMRAERNSQKAAARDAAKWCNHWARENEVVRAELRTAKALPDYAPMANQALYELGQLKSKRRRAVLNAKRQWKMRLVARHMNNESEKWARHERGMRQKVVATGRGLTLKARRGETFQRQRADTLHAQLAKIASETANYRERARPGVSRLLAGGSAVALRAVA